MAFLALVCPTASCGIRLCQLCKCLTILVPYRGSVKIEHTLAQNGSRKLWELMQNEPYVHSLGALTGMQAMQMVKGGLKAIYCSGWQVAADANAAAQVHFNKCGASMIIICFLLLASVRQCFVQKHSMLSTHCCRTKASLPCLTKHPHVGSCGIDATADTDAHCRCIPTNLCTQQTVCPHMSSASTTPCSVVTRLSTQRGVPSGTGTCPLLQTQRLGLVAL